jgi:hypothetical protein
VLSLLVVYRRHERQQPEVPGAFDRFAAGLNVELGVRKT